MTEGPGKTITFTLGGIVFEYDEEKEKSNIKKHGISFKNAARIFFDYDRIELYDEEHSLNEDRFNTIGDISAGQISAHQANNRGTVIGSIEPFTENVNDILFVVYTEKVKKKNDLNFDVIRIISARFATNFERGLYYGKII